MSALLEASRAGLFRRCQWLPNIVAGVIVGGVALPLALAFAIASGVRPGAAQAAACRAGAARAETRYHSTLAYAVAQCRDA